MLRPFDANPKSFERGLVVGKFSPLHCGHELVIQRAFERCRDVVLISYSKPELPGCEAGRREQWLAALFPRAKRLVLSDQQLQDRFGNAPLIMPANEADDSAHRRFTGFLCQQVLGVTVEAVFTSEDYGDGFARELTAYFRERNPSVPEVRHVLVDRERDQIPISATAIRADIHANRQWLPGCVYASFVNRICLLGGESSGKSTLAKALADHFGTVLVQEYGRELWESKHGALTLEDMVHIAETQIMAEEKACLQANRFVFCDTSPLTTAFYSQHLFKRVEPRLERLTERHYGLVVLCAPDFGFVQDGTRQDASFREQQTAWYINELTRRSIPFVRVTGSVAQRIAQISHRLAELQPCT